VAIVKIFIFRALDWPSSISGSQVMAKTQFLFAI